MRSVKKMRETFGLSQEQMAIYLNISRGFLSMVEAGKRTLPTTALAKLAELQKSLQSNLVYGQKAMQQQATKDLTELKTYAKQCIIKLYQLQQELDLLKEQHGQCLKVWLALGHLKQGAAATDSNDRDRLWLDILEAETLKKMRNCSLGKQAVLKLKIAALEREIEMAGKIKF